MKKLFFSTLCLTLLLTSCADDSLAPIITFDQATKGGYVKLLQESASRDIDLFNISGSSYTYSVEFVDEQQGDLTQQYTISATLDPAASGVASTGPLELRTYSASDFTTTDRGFKGLNDITITANELLALFGITGADLDAGDKFIMDGAVTLQDGNVYTAANSSAAVNGSAFGGHFRFNLTATCATELAGTYNYTQVSCWQGDPTVDGQVTLTLTSSGYDIDDFSLGAYTSCYGPGSTLPGGNLRMVDVCNRISITGASRWGEIYTWHEMRVEGAGNTDLYVDWSNDYGEAGISILHKPDGWPPLFLQ